MNALQPSRPPYSSTPPVRREAPRVRRSPRRHPHRVLAFEVGAKLGVNVVLGMVAVSALATLLPYTIAQQAKLEELQTEVAEMDQRVDRLQAEFNRHFDPQQAMSVMQEQSARINPNQRQVVWVTPSGAVARDSQDSSQEATLDESQP